MITGMYVGVDEKSVKAVNKAIMDILNSRADQKTIRLALKTLGSSVRSEVHDCTVEMTVNENK